MNLTRTGLIAMSRFHEGGGDPVSVGSMQRKPSLPISAQAAMVQYRGFDGVVWRNTPATIHLVDGLASLAELGEVKRYVATLEGQGSHSDLVYVIRVNDDRNEPSDVPPGFEFVGYDCGTYAGEYEHYSIIYNEVVFGIIPDMREAAKGLNPNLLFPSFGDVKHVLDKRTLLLANGEDLEDGDPEVFMVSVWKR